MMKSEQLLNLTDEERDFLLESSYGVEGLGADISSLLAGGGSADTAADVAERMLESYDEVNWERFLSLLHKVKTFNDVFPIGPRQDGPHEGPTLAVMQDGLRHDAMYMLKLVQFVQDGGTFVNSDDKIALVKFDGPLRFIRNGIHRAVAIWIGRESQALLPGEFQLEEFTFEQFNTPNLDPDIWFVTPFDPRITVRKADFFWFKQAVRDAVANGSMAATFIQESKTSYCVPRRADHTIKDFADKLNREFLALHMEPYHETQT
jgi:hypothetical protein